MASYRYLEKKTVGSGKGSYAGAGCNSEDNAYDANLNIIINKLMIQGRY